MYEKKRPVIVKAGLKKRLELGLFGWSRSLVSKAELLQLLAWTLTLNTHPPKRYALHYIALDSLADFIDLDLAGMKDHCWKVRS